VGHRVPADLERRMAGVPGAVVYGAKALPAGVVGPLPEGVGERDFQAWVIAVGQANGWLCAHFRPGRTRRGWLTPCQGDAAGFPDTLLIRPVPAPAKLLVAELKVDDRRPTPAQQAWLVAFESAGVPTFVWRPEQAAEIIRILEQP
jgi:hypothetical protein